MHYLKRKLSKECNQLLKEFKLEPSDIITEGCRGFYSVRGALRARMFFNLCKVKNIQFWR